MKNKKILAFVFMIGCAVVAGSATWLWQKKSGESTELIAGQTLGAKGDNKSKPVSVNTVTAQQRDYAVRLTANGVVTSLNVVEVRAQISSVIEKVHIKEGQFVRAGDLLFTLDHRTESSNLAKAEAQLSKELASLSEVQRQAARSRELFEKKFQSQSILDASQTALQAQQAVVDAAKASVAAAKVNLTFSKIVAPASGRTGLINVFAGSLVQPTTTGTALVTITQMDPIAITFPLPQRNLADALASMQRGESVVLASLPDGRGQFKGKLQFIDNGVDPVSGTVKVKALFANKEMKLWPGAYANVDVSVQTLKDVVVVPQDALVIGVNATTVFVVDAEQKAAQKKVEVVASFGSEAVVRGIAAGTRVILEGKQNLRPGTPLKLADIASASASAAVPASASQILAASAP